MIWLWLYLFGVAFHLGLAAGIAYSGTTFARSQYLWIPFWFALYPAVAMSLAWDKISNQWWFLVATFLLWRHKQVPTEELPMIIERLEDPNSRWQGAWGERGCLIYAKAVRRELKRRVA